MFRRTLAALAGVAAMAWAGQAGAAVYTATYYGTISGTDRAGVILDVGSYENQAFVASFTYDTALGVIGPGLPAGVGDELTGGMTDAWLSIGGSAFHFGALSFNQLFSVPHLVGHLDRDAASANQLNVAIGNADNTPASMSMPVDIVPMGGASFGVSGGFRINNTDADGRVQTITRYVVQEGAGPFGMAAPVPEPRTWAVMIAGFGLAGAALRRRRAAAA